MGRIHIEKIVFGGQGLGRMDGKTVFVWNALPDEDVEVKILKEKKNFAEAVAVKIYKPSPEREEPKESHYLSSSPWQMMKYEAENKYKKEMFLDVFKRNGDFDLKDVDICFDDRSYNYRNKVEFNFTGADKGVSLAYFNRDTNEVFSVTESALANYKINKTAQEILSWINKNKIQLQNLDKLIIKSNQEGQVIAALFLKNKIKDFELPKLSEKLIGFFVYIEKGKYVEKLTGAGQDFLSDELMGIKMDYGISSFFQVNLPVFEKALKDISDFTEDGVLDYYSGVGSISIPLYKRIKKCILVDGNKEAIEFAEKNIKNNKIKNYEAVWSLSENITDLIEKDKTVIFDPPRAGLDKKIIKTVLSILPKRIIYLSCNPSTQARDLKELKEKYKIIFVKLYNFFPRTPHLESLCVLDKKE